MKVVEYKFIENGNGLNIKFDKYFKHIKLQKLENCDNIHDNIVLLDYDSIELSFSKQKDSITLNISNESNMIIIIIWEIDKEEIGYQSYMFNKNAIKKPLIEQNNELQPILYESMIGKGLELLLRKQNIEGDIRNDKREIDCIIKNENIFAEIKRK